MLYEVITRRPAGGLHVDVLLVEENGDHFALPRPGGVAPDDGEAGEVGRDIVEMDRLGVFELESHSPGSPRPQSGGAGVELHGNGQLDAFRNNFV